MNNYACASSMILTVYLSQSFAFSDKQICMKDPNLYEQAMQ